MEFERKFLEVKKLENIERALGFIFSRCGFTREAENYCREKGIACSEDERWLLPYKHETESEYGGRGW
jgi:hypothetical protein